MTTDTTNYDASWAARWAAQAVALLGALRQVEESGQAPQDEVVANAFEDGTFEAALEDHFRQALTAPAELYRDASRVALDALLARGDVQAATRLSEVLHEQAVQGWWVQQVPLGQSTCGALEGESTLFGLGVFMDRGQDTAAPVLPTAAHVDHLKALLLSDYQVTNAFRVVVMPVLLGTPQTASISAWQVAFLRLQLEQWAENNLQGHPDVAQAQAWLASAGVELGTGVRYSDLLGRQAAPGAGMSLMDAYTVVGLVMHSPQDPVSDEAMASPGPLSSMLFPRTQAGQVLSYLEDEQKHIRDALGSGLVHGAEAVHLKTALARGEAELRELRAVYGACLLPPHDPQAARPDGASKLVHQFLAQALLGAPGFLMVVASACGFYESLKPTREALRYMRLRTMLNHAGGRVGLDDSMGLQGELLLDNDNHQAVVHLHHSGTGMYAGMGTWPLLEGESPASFLNGLQAALAEAGVEMVAREGAGASGLH